jgi:hypothetical protein
LAEIRPRLPQRDRRLRGFNFSSLCAHFQASRLLNPSLRRSIALGIGQRHEIQLYR